MNIARWIALTLVAVTLAGCKYETFPDPELSARDLELIALAPQPRARENDPYTARYRMKNPTGEPPGTIVVETDARFLYLVEEGGTALRYHVSPGHEAYQWRGTAFVRRKTEWPSWTPGSEARSYNPGLASTVPGGPNNPLGARALYLHDEAGRDTLYRIHGTNEPERIGQAVSLGCIRMQNIDAIDLYNRTKIGARVVVR